MRRLTAALFRLLKKPLAPCCALYAPGVFSHALVPFHAAFFLRRLRVLHQGQLPAVDYHPAQRMLKKPLRQFSGLRFLNPPRQFSQTLPLKNCPSTSQMIQSKRNRSGGSDVKSRRNQLKLLHIPSGCGVQLKSMPPDPHRSSAVLRIMYYDYSHHLGKRDLSAQRVILCTLSAPSSSTHFCLNLKYALIII